METTTKLYYQDSHLTSFEATVLSCEYIAEKHYYKVLLDRTAFFPEGGGQFADTGYLDHSEVFDVHIKNDLIYHYCKEALPEGSIVTGRIDFARRFDFMQQHSAEHLVSGLVHQHYGYNNVGFHLGLEETTLDFDGPLSKEALLEIEALANEAVYKNISVVTLFPSKEELASIDYRSKKELDGEVRIVSFPGYDTCACCAPHVKMTGEIGLIKIVNSMTHRGGVRVTILCGRRALQDYRLKLNSVEQISVLLSAKQDTVFAAVQKLKEDVFTLTGKINELQKRILQAKIEQLPDPSLSKDAILFLDDLESKAVRDCVNELCTRYSGICGIFVGTPDNGYTFILGSTSTDLKQTAGLLRSQLKAKCGGSSQMIQGSVAAKPEEILNALSLPNISV